MKVLQINSVCGIGSTGRIATDIHAILKEQGHESYIAFGRDNPMNCDTAIRIGNKLDNYTHVAKTRILDMHGFGSKKATKEFINKIKELNPDVIHLHNIHGYYINVEILFEYLKEANKPVVWTLHDCWPFTGHCTHFEYVGCDCWKTKGDHKCTQKKSYPTSLLFNNSRNNYKRKNKAFTGVKDLTIVTPSMWLARLVNQSFLSEYPVKVINNGIDLDMFKPTKSKFRDDYCLNNKFIILGVANVWNNKKGLNDFIKLSRLTNSHYVIVLVGISERQLQKLPKNIVGIPKTNSVKELAEIYSAADVFINPTYEDNFPTTNLESLACGTPVITYDTGGSPEAIDYASGYVVKKGDVEGIHNLLKVLKDNDYRSEDYLTRAKLFDKKRMLSEYHNIYSRVELK